MVAAALAQHRQERLDHGDGAQDAGLKLGSKPVQVHQLDGRDLAATRIVGEGVQPWLAAALQLRLDCLDHTRNLLQPGEVERANRDQVGII